MLGAGADDLILLCARSFAGPGDTIAVPPAPTYPLFRIAAAARGRRRSGDGGAGARPSRAGRTTRTGALDPLPAARPLVVDEAYFEYAGETAVPLLDDGVVVLRTFSKVFGLAGARIGYALAPREVAEELSARQAPAPVAGVAVELALAALASPPDVAPVLEERERLASALRALGLEPLDVARELPLRAGRRRARGSATPSSGRGSSSALTPTAIRISVRDREDDDLLLEALARVLDRPAPVAAAGSRRVRQLRATAETRIARSARRSTARAACASRPAAGSTTTSSSSSLFHAGLDLVVEGAGDLETGEHHTVEDTALAFGEALDEALGDRRGIARYGDAVVPMDDALARAAVDLGGRPFAELAIEPEPGLARARLREPRPGRAARDPRRGARPRRAPRGRGRVQGGRPRAANGAAASSRPGIPSTKGLL